MGDGNQIHCPLSNIFSIQVSHTIFRDHIADISPAESNTGTLIEKGNDSRDLSAFGGRFNREDRLSPRCKGGPPHKIRTPAYTAIKNFSDGLGRCLAGQINLPGTVNGHHISLPGNDKEIIGVVDRSKPDVLIAMHEVVGLSISHAEGGYTFSPIQIFPTVVDNPFSHQFHNPVGQQFRMYSKMLLVFQLGQNSIRNAPVPDLEGVAVLNDASHVFPNSPGNLVGDTRFELQQGFIMGYHIIDVVEMNQRIAIDPGHLRIDL